MECSHRFVNFTTLVSYFVLCFYRPKLPCSVVCLAKVVAAVDTVSSFVFLRAIICQLFQSEENNINILN